MNKIFSLSVLFLITGINLQAQTIYGCMDENAENFNPQATVQTKDQYGNLECTYSSCLNVPMPGCIYISIEYSGYSQFFPGFDANTCSAYGGTPCEGESQLVEGGCMDPNASNYDINASIQAMDENGYIMCKYTSCYDSPSIETGGCIYSDAFGPHLIGVGTSDCGHTALTNCERIIGCTNPSADNYISTANFDDGSCIITACPYPQFFEYDSNLTHAEASLCLTYIIEGCTDNQAENFNGQANLDDGSCIVEGCKDSLAGNYNPVATHQEVTTCMIYGCTNSSAENFQLGANYDDGSCTIGGCTLIYFGNYNPAATYDDGSCDANSIPVLGCTYVDAFNYNPIANKDDGSCVDKVNGCTNAEAPNFNSSANTDDGSCVAVVNGCTDDTAFNYDSYANNNDGSCVAVVNGCTDATAFNYVPSANTDDGSCVAVVNGCTDASAFNYNPSVNTDDGSCEPFRVGCMDTDYIEYSVDNNLSNQDLCITLLVYGCTDVNAFNFDDNANTNDGSCWTEVSGCTEPYALNFEAYATMDDGSCIPAVFGCIDDYYIEYNELANMDDGSCLNLWSEAYEQLTTSMSSFQQAFDTWNSTINLSAGWNMFGYGCPEPIGLVQAMSEYSDKIIIVKDNYGNPYLPEYRYIGLDSLTPGYGYQIKLMEAIEDFSLCDLYVNDIPEYNIASLQEELASAKAELDSLYGCMDEGACNFDSTAVLNDSSCEYESCLDDCGVINGDNSTCIDCAGVPNGTAEDLGCGCGNPTAQEGYDCEGNEITLYRLGDIAHGGIIFYVDSTGQRGLVASSKDIGRRGLVGGPTYEQGFNDISSIGGGQQNFLDMLSRHNQNHAYDPPFSEVYFSDVPVANAVLEFEEMGYTDWYIPSIDELVEMIDYSKANDNILGFLVDENMDLGIPSEYYYLSSTDKHINYSNVHYVGYSYDWGLGGCGGHCERLVRPIRSFGYDDALCVDETACNFNLPTYTWESSWMPNNWNDWPSCEYAQDGYTCIGTEVLYKIGDFAQGGIVFYVDSTGQHGLVSAMENVSESPVQWNDANRILEDYESEGYSDWYLPSLEELNQMRIKIGPGNGVGNGLGDIGEFHSIGVQSTYWSSSTNEEYDYAWYINFRPATESYYNGSPSSQPKINYTHLARPIRSF